MSKPKTVLQQRRKFSSLQFDFFWTATKKRTDKTSENVLRSFTFLVLGKSCIRVQPAIMTQEPGKSWIGVWNLKCGITRNLLVCYHQFLLTNVSTTNFYFSPSISSPFPPPISTDQCFHHQFLLTNFSTTNFYWPTQISSDQLWKSTGQFVSALPRSWFFYSLHWDWFSDSLSCSCSATLFTDVESPRRLWNSVKFGNIQK